MQYLVGIRENLGYLDGEDSAVVDDGVGSLARADLEADGGGEEVGRLLEHLRELPPVGGEELPVGDSVPGRGAREREQDRRDAAVAALARRGARAGRLPRYSLDRVVVRRRGRPPPRHRSRRAERRLPGGGGGGGLTAEKLRHSHFLRFWVYRLATGGLHYLLGRGFHFIRFCNTDFKWASFSKKKGLQVGRSCLFVSFFFHSFSFFSFLCEVENQI